MIDTICYEFPDGAYTTSRRMSLCSLIPASWLPTPTFLGKRLLHTRVLIIESDSERRTNFRAHCPPWYPPRPHLGPLMLPDILSRKSPWPAPNLRLSLPQTILPLIISSPQTPTPMKSCTALPTNLPVRISSSL